MIATLWLAIALPAVPFLWPSPESRGLAASGSIAGAAVTGATYAEAVGSTFFRRVTVGYILVLGMVGAGYMAKMHSLSFRNASALNAGRCCNSV